jgi:hypothetical protein
MAGQAAVIIPFYKNDLTDHELIALEQCFRILNDHTIIAIKPHKLILTQKASAYPFSQVISFDDKYFANIHGYNELMLSDVFYGRFLEWEYMLIYQLDAFVFKDELDYWCQKNMDYIGAPWIRREDYRTWAKAFFSLALQHISRRFNLKKYGVPGRKQFDNNVGNGGFSLRRTQKFHDLCISLRPKIEKYNTMQVHEYNEDAFWSIEVNRKSKVLKKPHYLEALKFAVEFFPTRAFVLNNEQLPFGCHAWEKYPDFWGPIFAHYGYDINKTAN